MSTASSVSTPSTVHTPSTPRSRTPSMISDDDSDEVPDFSRNLSRKLNKLKSLLASPNTPGGTSGEMSSDSLQSSPGFAIKETKSPQNKNWIKNFKLPDTVSFKYIFLCVDFRGQIMYYFLKTSLLDERRYEGSEKQIFPSNLPHFFLSYLQFSPKVKEALKAEKLFGSQRDEFTRDVCNSMKMHSLFPNREEKQRVASMIIERYPFLTDSLGGGTVSCIIYNSIYSIHSSSNTRQFSCQRRVL